MSNNLFLDKIYLDCRQAVEKAKLAQTDSQRMLSELKTLEPIRNNFLNFVLYTKEDYIVNWHHKYIADKLQLFADGKIKNLMLFCPPQTGKSELSTRHLPGYVFGHHPEKALILTSYSADSASQFNIDIQRIMASNNYSRLFPNVRLARPGEKNYRRNSKIFDIVDYSGFLLSVGIGGQITGKKADMLLMDDIIKNALEAYSETYRERVWNEYTKVLKTRLHNNSQQLFTITRWHEDDLAGRILEADKQRLFNLALRYELIPAESDIKNFEYNGLCNLLPDDKNKWEVVKLPGLKVDDNSPGDPRKPGEALWPEMHSADDYLEFKRIDIKGFSSMIQQDAVPESGDILKGEWFKYFRLSQLPANVVWNFFSDTAYGKTDKRGKQTSDNSATGCYTIYEGGLYIKNMSVVNLSFPDFVKYIKLFYIANGYTQSSLCEFEPKASGTSIVQQLQKEKVIIKDANGNDKEVWLNIMEAPPPTDSKETIAKAVSSIIQSGRVFLLKDAYWVPAFISECNAFPNGKYDDQVDFLIQTLLNKILIEFTEPSISF